MFNRNPLRTRAFWMFSLVLFLFLMIPLGRADGPQQIASDSSAIAGAGVQEAIWRETEDSSSSISEQRIRGKGCTFNVALENISSSTAYNSIRIRAMWQTEITDVQSGYWTLVSSSSTLAVLKPPQEAIPIGLFIFGISIQPGSGSNQQLRIEWIGSKETVLCTRVLNVGCGRKSDEARLAARQRDDKETPVQGEKQASPGPGFSCKDISASITSDEVLTKVDELADCDVDFTAAFVCNATNGTTTYTFTNTTTDDDPNYNPSYKWTIYDSNYSVIYSTATTNASYTFSSGGTYKVELCAYGTACGTTINDCDDHIIDINIPRAGFSWKPKQCAPKTIVFTDESEGSGLSYNWDFGDSSSSPEHAFPSEGSYLVCLTVTSSEGCNRICQSVRVEQRAQRRF